MKQQINLYKTESESESEASKILFSLDNLFTGSMIIIAVLAGMYGLEYRKVWVLEGNIENIESQIVERKQMVKKLNASIKSKASLKKVDNSLEGLKKELELKRQSVSKLRDVHQSGSTGFSGYFESLSKNILDGVWLKEFSVYGGGTGFEFKGQAIDGQLIMGFLEGLSKDSIFKNKKFTTLEVVSGGGESPDIRFVVNTGGRY